LAERGFVRQRKSGGPYSLGWKIVLLAKSLSAESRLVSDVRPCLEDLLHHVGHTVNLAVLTGTQVMYLDCLVPNRAVSLYIMPGSLLPAHATALGKVLLAHLPPPELDDALARMSFEPITPRTIVSAAQFRAGLEDVRRQGYAVDRGEFTIDVGCIAAPILGSHGQTIAAISVSARSAELPSAWEQTSVPLVVAAAREASERIGALSIEP
jgi:IclR family acetate operon transcriptional repressor